MNDVIRLRRGERFMPDEFSYAAIQEVNDRLNAIASEAEQEGER